MAIPRQKKESIITDLHKKVEGADGVVFINFHGLKVSDIFGIRKELRKVGAELKVAKKRLAKRVLDGFGFSGTIPALEGEVAFIFKKGDVIDAVKVAYEAAKKTEGLKILGGIFERAYISVDMVKTLASIPPRKVLLGRLVGSIASPLSGFLRVTNGPVRNLVGVLQAISKNRS